VRAVDDALALGDLVHRVNENGTLALKFFDHKAVVDDLFADVNWRPEGLKGNPDNVDGSHYARAKAARLQQK
jgi:hypothetical protein